MKWPHYPDCRNSGIESVGRLPVHWDVVALQHLFRIVGGATPKSDVPGYWDGDITWVTPADFGADNSLWLQESRRTITEAGMQSCSTELLPEGTVIVAVRAPIGPIGIAGKPMATNQGCKGLVGNSVEARFVAYQLSVNQVALNAVGRGTTFLELSATDLGAFRIAIPPLEEQVHIADFLDHETAKIDALIAKQEQLIATLREDRAATITHAVTRGLNGDVATSSVQKFGISGFPICWEIGPLKHAAIVLDCKHLTAEFFDDGYPLASIREVQSRYLDLSSAKRTSGDYYRQLREGGRDPRSGDIIFSRNATVGEAAQVLPDHEPFAMGQDVCLIRPMADRMHSSYVWYVLRSGLVATQIEMMMIGSTFKRINVEGIRNLVVTWPPLDEQQAIINFLDVRCGAIDALILKANSMIDTLREYRAALITDAVTGKIDVRGVA